MVIRKSKMIISVILVIAMTLSNAGVSLFANNLYLPNEDANADESSYENQEFNYYDEGDIDLDETETTKELEELEEDIEYDEADKAADAVGASEDSVGASEDSVGASQDSEGASQDSVGASSASPEEKNETNAVGPSEDSVGDSEDSVGASEDSVGASSASPEEKNGANAVGDSEDTEGASQDSVGASSASPETKAANETVATTETSEVDSTKNKKAKYEDEVATESEAIEFIEEEIATLSQLKNIDEMLLGAGDGDGTHVHKICGVGETDNCLHTEFASHTSEDVGDYAMIEVDEDTILAEVIDALVGVIDDGEGEPVAVDHPEYLYLTGDVIFDKNAQGAPRDAALATYDYYTIDLKRDLYLCLNGHTLTNFVFSSTGNFKLVITDCVGGGKISSVTDDVLLFYLPVQVFGVNDKITLNCSRMLNMDSELRVKYNTFYNVKFDGTNAPAFSYSEAHKNHIIRLYVNNTSTTTINTIFENCDIANWGQTGGEINATGTILIGIYTNGTVVFKNSNIYGNDGVKSNIINTERASYISNVYFKGRNTIHDNNMSVCTANANMFHFERSKVYVQNEGLYLYNNSKNFGSISFNIAANCTFEVEENSALSFNNNKIAKSVSSNNTVLFDVAGVFNCYGNLEVTNNKIVNCGESKTGTYLAGIRINDGKFIKFGNSKVTVTGNASFADDAVTFADDNTYSMHHLYQVYHLNRNANYMFIMNDGCKLDIGSRIEGISFPNGFSGKIVKFTTDEVSDVSLVSTIFKADTFFYNDYEVRVVSDYAKPVHRASGHKHKLCGVAEGVACTHEEIAAHTNILEYYALQNGIALDAAKELMQGFATTDAPEHFFLGGNITATEKTIVTIKRDLYLCLNGNNISNILFTATNNAKLYITNCGASSAIRNNLNGSRVFCDQCVQVYGVNKNITINANVITSTSANLNNTVFYNIVCDGTNIPTNEMNVFGIDVTSDANITIENVVIKNYGASIEEKAGKSIFYLLGKVIANIKNIEVYNNKCLTGGVMQIGKSGYTTNVTFKGENKIYNNRFDQTASLTRLFALAYCNFTVAGTLDVYDNYKTGANILLLFDIGCNFTVNEGATFKFCNNKLENNKSFMNIINLANNANVKINFLGNVEITDNKYVNCDGTTNGTLLASLYIQVNNPAITLGSGKVTIKNNKAYKDEGVTIADDVTYCGYHAYEVYSTTQSKESLFVMASGKKFNPESSFEDIGFPIGQSGKIIKWTSNEVDDLSIISTVFKPDSYYFSDFEAQAVNNYATLVHTENSHKHKICGVGESEACTHTETAAHTGSVTYYPIRPDIDIKLKQKLIAGDTATSDIEYLYLTEDLTSDTLVVVTLLRDVYICLNGHSMTNIRFSGDGKKVYVTNCKDTKGVITHRTNVDFLFSCNVEAYGKKIGDDYNIGLNTYCVVLSYNTTSDFVNLYNVDVDGTGVTGNASKSRFFVNNSGTMIAENVKIRDCSAASEIWINHVGKGGTLILKNTEAYNITNFRSGFIYVGGDATSKLIFKGYNKIYNNTSHTNNSYFISCASGKFIIDENSTLELYENKLVQSNNIYNLLKMHTGTTASLDTKVGSTLSIHDNIFYKNVNYQAFVALFSTAEQSLLGNLSIVDNKFYNCNESNKTGDYLAGININDGVNLKIGSGKITIKDNKSYSDEGVNLASDKYYQHHVYQVMSGNVDNVFIQTEGTKFNTESRVYGIAYKSAASGTIMKWTSETVNAADIDKYDTCFTADTYMIEDYVVRRQGDYAVIVSSENHTHRPCGVGRNDPCLHTEIASHSEAYTYVKIGTSSLENVDTFIKTFEGNSSHGTGSGALYVYLAADIIVTTVKTITPVRPVYLCLNGHLMSGFRFLGSNQVTITNCKKTQATFREILDTNICFQSNTYLYGIDRNLTINTSRIMDIGGSYGATNTEALFYGVIFDGTGMNTGSGSVNSKFYFNKNNARATFENCMFTNFKRQARMFWFHGGNANSNIIFKDVDVATNSGTDYQLMYSDVAAINIAFKGRNRFWNNTMQGTNETARVIDFSTGKVTIEGEGLFVENNKTLGSKYLVFFYSNADFLLKEGATLRIKDNVFSNKTTAGTVNYFVEFNTECKPKLFGNFEVIGNKLGNCGTDNTKYISALKFGLEDPIEIGSGKIIVKDNKSYADAELTTEADDDAYPAQHMFQLLSFAKTHSLFTMAAGKKLNPESKIDGVAFYYASGTGKLLEWDSATYGTDSYHEDVFIPDKFFNEYLGVGVKDGYARLTYASTTADEHNHKVCGKANGEACTHTEVASHTKIIEYKKIGERLKEHLDLFATLMSSADNIPEDDMYFYLDEDIVSSKTRNITLRNNIYICLNGHKMSGFTFNTANGNTLYITNCASGVGRIEHTLSDSGIMFRLSTEIYGVNKNLVPKSGSIIAHDAKNVVFYDTLFDNDGRTSSPGTTIIHTGTDGASFIIEKCKFVNFEKGLEMLKTSTNNATVILKNTEFEKCNNMASRFFQTYNNTSSRNKLIFKGENSIHDCVSTTENASSGAAFYFGYSDVTIESGGSLKYYNNQFKTANRNCIMWFDNSKLNIAENASLEMTDNLMYQFKGSSDVTILLGISQNSNTVNVYGNLKITDNIVSNCTNKTTKYMAALDLRGGVINIGNGVITVNNNKSGKNADGTGDVDASVRGYHMFNLYSANISNIFTVKSGSKINLNSRVDVTFYDSIDGKVMLWNSNTTSDLNAYSTIFTTDPYGDEVGLEVFIKNGYAVVESKDNNHVHKICGVASTSTCTHSLVSKHTNSAQFVRITEATSADKLVTTLQGDATSDSTLYYFLKRDYNVTSEKVVTLKKDLYLCLNGYSLTGFRFAGNGRKIYICNCKENKKVSVGSKLSGNITFATGVHVYGQNKNITVVSGRVCDMTATYNNPNVYFYNVDVDGNSSNYASGEFAVFYITKASTTLNIEDCDFYGHKQFGYFLSPQVTSTVNIKNSTFRDMSNCKKSYLYLWKDKSNQSTMNLYGDVKFDNISFAGNTTANIPANQFSGCNFNVKNKATVSFTRWNVSNCREMIRFSTNAKFNVEEGATFIVDNNVLNKTDVSGENNAIIAYHNDNTVSCNILGNFKLTNNKINNCGTKKNGTSLAAFYIERNAAGPVTIGKGKIEIYNNKSYKDNGKTAADDKTYNNHHMFGVYATNKTLVFTQKSGTKMNSGNRIENVAFSTPDYSGTVVKWTTNEVNDSDIGRFNEMFTADPFWDDELWTEEKNNNGVIAFGAPTHKHKLCGVGFEVECTHHLATHSEIIGYRKISSMYTTGAEIRTLLQTGGGFILTSNINIASLNNGADKYITVTPTKDLYICLNGFSLTGVLFSGGTNYAVYVTNCQNTTGTFGNTAVENAGFNNISVEIYGINKNINVVYDRLANLNGAATANQRFRLYSAKFTKGLGKTITNPYVYIGNTSNKDSGIEDCEFTNLNVHSLVRSIGARKVDFSNNIVKNITTSNFLMSFESGKTDIFFGGNNVIDKINYANKASDYFIHFANYKDNKIKIDGNFTITNCVSYYNSNHFFHIGQGQLSITEGSNLTIKNNELYNTAIYGRGLLYLGSESKISILGDLIISENAFVATRKSHSDVGLWFSNPKESIEIGNTKIIISSNSTTNARANVRNLYSYYGDNALLQKSGTKLNSEESRIDTVAINSEDYTGFIYKTWNEENVTNYNSINPLNVFGADTYASRKGMIVKQEGDKVILTFADHFHKLCGILSTMSCAHRNGIDHGISDTDLNIMRQYTSLTWENMDDLKRKLSVGGDYFLIRKVKFNEPTVINLENDLYLCLRALYMENVIFTSDNGSTAYITSCIEEIEEGEDEEEEEEEEITEDGETISSPTANMGSKRNDRGEIAIVATASTLGTLFRTNVEVYSPYNNINIYANKLYEDDETKDNNHLILQGVRVIEDEETKSSSNDYVTAKNVKEVIFENVTISTFSQVNNFIKGNIGNLIIDSVQMNNNQIKNSFVDIESGVTGLATRSHINLKGNSKATENKFKNFIKTNVDLLVEGEMDLNNNYFEESIMNVNARFEEYENGILKINSNDIKRVSGDQNIIYVATSSIAIGSIDISENNVINANASNNSGYVSMFRLAGADTKMSLGSGEINIINNNIDADENRFKYHHLYSLLMDNADFPLNLYGGQTLNTNSKITLSLKNPYLGGLFKNFPYDDQNIVDAMFIVDENEDADTGFNRARIAAYYENGDVTLDAIYIVHYHANLESLRKPLKIFGKEEVVTKAYYDQPFYVDGQVFNVNTKRRWIEFYMTQDNSSVSLGQHEKGLNPKEKHLHLYASWSPSPTYKDEWLTPEKKPDRVERNTHIKDGLFLKSDYGFWMYVMDVNANDAAMLLDTAGDHEYAEYNREKTAIYLKNATYNILDDDEYKLYKFGQFGNMETGFVDINDSRYYFEETGENQGAMRYEPLEKDGKKYVFDSYGRLVKIVKLGTDQVVKYATPYNYHIGFDYYPQIPALVGWRDKLFEEILVRRDDE